MDGMDTSASSSAATPSDVAGPPPGPLTTAELAAAVPDARDRRRYERIWHGMYRREDQVDDLLLRSRALARTFPDGVLRGRSAALLWGDDSAPAGTPPEIWLPATRQARPGRVFRYGALPGYAVAEISGLRVTTPLRTCRDLAVDLEFEDAVVAVERLCAMVAELPVQLRAAAEHPSGRGARRLGSVVAACDPLSTSGLSTRARLVLADAGCGDFRHGHRVVLGAGTVELPLADPVARCVVFASPSPVRRDRAAARHQSLLQGAGWTVILVRERERGASRMMSIPRAGAVDGWAAVSRRAAGLLAARWPGTELRLPASGGPVDDPHGLWDPPW